jgi:hypothetical protein
VIATAPVTESPTAPTPRVIGVEPKPTETRPNAVAPPATKPEKLAALPPPSATPRAAAVASEKPQITVIRGGRQPATSRRAPTAEKSKLAALPPATAAHSPTATDAPPIIVLRGGRNTRYALASSATALPPPPAHPILTVIRGARPRLVLYPYVQPGPLILHISD